LNEKPKPGGVDDNPFANSPQKAKRALGLIFLVILMDVIGITLLGPVAPSIVMRYDNSALMVTMIIVIYAGGQFFASPLLGKLGDRVGRRPVLLLSLVGQALGYLIFAIGGSLWILFLGRLIGGITSGNMTASAAYVADISKPEERSKNFALISSAWSLGLILGPAMGGLFGQFDLDAPSYAAGAISLFSAILGYFILPESLSVSRREKAPLRLNDFNPIISIIAMARKPGVGILLLVSAIFSFAFNGINSISALFVIQKFSASPWQLSLMMMMVGGSNALTNTFLVPRWMPRFGEKLAGSAALVGLAVFSVLIYLSPLMWMAFFANTIGSATSSFIFPALTILSLAKISQREVGEMLGVTNAIGSLMNIFGPIGAGLIYDTIMPGAPFLFGAACLLAAAVLLFRTSSKPQPGI